MAVKRYSGCPEIEGYKKAPSTVFPANSVVTVNGTGALVPITSGTDAKDIVGTMERSVSATDLDFATPLAQAKFESVEINGEAENLFLIDVSAGSAVQALVGTYVDFADNVSANVGASVKKHIKVVKIISTTQIVGKIMGELVA
jgi:hypothetical protein